MRISMYSRGKTRKATSLVELLVVIVIFMVGILAVVQIFPGGFKVISTTASFSVATQLADNELERVQARSDQMPEQIVPVNYITSGANVIIERDPYRSADDLGVAGVAIDVNGDVRDGNNRVLGPWHYLTGPNNFRRVIGEGGRVPAPRAVGTRYGGLMILQFSPIIYSGFLQGLLQVYGNDLVRMEGAPSDTAQVRDYNYFIQDAQTSGARLHVPADATAARSYRVSFTGLYSNAGKVYRRQIDTTVNVAAGSAPAYSPVDLSTVAGTGFTGLEINSLQVARNYALVGAFSADNPYEYQLLDDRLGLILFNPVGYNYIERRENGERTPLLARVDYDVYDWSIIREEFRVPEGGTNSHKLMLRGLKVKGDLSTDNRAYPGLNVSVADGTGGTEIRDFILMDMETGGVFLENSSTRLNAGARKKIININRSSGNIRFIDADNTPANGITGELVLPGSNSPTDVNMTGRAVRALYQANNEWAVQVTKAADSYDPYVPDDSSVRQLGAAEFYAGGSGAYYTGNAFHSSERNYRIYFPPMDAGKKVTIGEIWYTDGSSVRQLTNQDFIIQSSPADPVGLPYVDIRSAAPSGAVFDYDTYGYAVRGVKGASLSVRVLWNPARFNWTNNQANNMQVYDEWARNYKRTVVDGALKRGLQ